MQIPAGHDQERDTVFPGAGRERDFGAPETVACDSVSEPDSENSAKHRTASTRMDTKREQLYSARQSLAETTAEGRKLSAPTDM
jgi:hypothetical protein